MGDVVNMHDRPTPVDDTELVEDLARFADGTLGEAQVKARHRLSNEEWKALGANDELVRRIENRKLARIRGGQTKRERAQIEIVDGPPILAGIMRNPDSNARHVVDAVKALDALATGGGEAAAAGTFFEITINLGEDTLHFKKPIAISPNDNDTDPNDIDVGPQDVIAAIAMSKSTDDDNGGHL
jgi:hypothetical protein